MASRRETLGDQVAARAGYACERCSRYLAEVGGHVHHRLPRSRGGPDDLFNLALLCGAAGDGCHQDTHANPERAIKEGWTVEGQIVRGVYVGPNRAYQAAYPKVNP